MPFVYIVRCNFTRPDKEDAWNAWYSGPKIKQMLAKPHFRTCQRFRLASGTGRSYLTLWTLNSLEAFKTPQYTSDWGFFEWAPYISDWSRDLFDATHAQPDAFNVPGAGALHVISFDGLSEAEAKDTILTPTLTLRGREGWETMLWLPVVGLDRHTPMIGTRVLGATSHASWEPLQPRQGQEALYAPICPRYEA
jgi:hypothetical protein